MDALNPNNNKCGTHICHIYKAWNPETPTTNKGGIIIHLPSVKPKHHTPAQLRAWTELGKKLLIQHNNKLYTIYQSMPIPEPGLTQHKDKP